MIVLVYYFTHTQKGMGVMLRRAGALSLLLIVVWMSLLGTARPLLAAGSSQQQGVMLAEPKPGSVLGGLFYFNPDDPRVILPKQGGGLGWTLNFASYKAWLIFAATIGLIIVVRSRRRER